MNWQALKRIYIDVLKHNYKFQYSYGNVYALLAYHKNGALKCRIEFYNGIKHGTEVWWDDDESLNGITEWYKGDEVCRL